jgi:hypothetical protein
MAAVKTEQGDKLRNKKRSRCGRCEQCNRPDCGECPHCKDKLKFGGSGRRHQACVTKRCAFKTMKNMKEDNQPTIDSIYKKTLFINLNDSDSYSTQNSYVVENSPNHHNRFIRTTRCGLCTRCLEKNCGECSSCKEMPRFGGTQRIRQACIHRECHFKNFKHKVDKNQPSIGSIFGTLFSIDDDENISKCIKTEYVEKEEDIKSEPECKIWHV